MPDAIEELKDLIRQLIAEALMKMPITGVATIDPSYSSGNVLLRLPPETAAPAMGDQVFFPYSSGNPPAASDKILYHKTKTGQRVAAGKIVGVSSLPGVNAPQWNGLQMVSPGETLLQSADTEQSTTSATYVEKKAFTAGRPGRYRIKFELSRDGGTTKAKIQLKLPDGTNVDASTEVTYSGTVYPTFSSTQTIDMTVDAPANCRISVMLKNDSGPTQTAYIRNCRMYYAIATSAATPYNAVLVD